MNPTAFFDVKNMQELYLEIRNVTAYRGDNLVFTNLNLNLKRQQNTCILGPNGSGKSTLLKLLTREIYPVVKPDSFVKIDGSETAVLWELRQKIGLVSQDLQTNYDAHVLGRDVVMSGLFGAIGMHGHFHITDEHHARTDKALEKFGLQHLQQRRYWHLSTGQQRKFLLARAMIHNPEVLVLDEPTNGLDIKASFALMSDLSQLAQQGTTLLLATHHTYEILPEIERVIALKNGEVFADTTKAELLQDAPLSTLYDTPLTVASYNGYYQVYPLDARR